MFGNKTKDFSGEKINSIIGSDAVIEGSFTTKDTTRIDGVIKGDIHSAGTLIIGKGAKIEGKVKAANIMIAGEITGDLHIKERIEATGTSKIIGDIVAKSLSIDENAKFQGKCTMNMNGSQKETENKTKQVISEVKTES